MSVNLDTIDPKKVFIKVLNDGIRNSIFFAFATFIMIVIMNYVSWRFVSFIPSLIMVVIFAFNWIKFILLDLPLAIVGPIIAFKERNRFTSSGPNHQRYLFLGNIVQVIENSISFIYFLFLYRAYYHEDLFGILNYIGLGLN